MRTGGGVLMKSIAVAILAAMALPPCAVAQNYPEKTIRFVAPYAPGGTTDLLTRAIAQKLTDALGVSVVTDNRPGAGGRPRAVSRAPACGMRTSAT